MWCCCRLGDGLVRPGAGWVRYRTWSNWSCLIYKIDKSTIMPFVCITLWINPAWGSFMHSLCIYRIQVHYWILRSVENNPRNVIWTLVVFLVGTTLLGLNYCHLKLFLCLSSQPLRVATCSLYMLYYTINITFSSLQSFGSSSTNIYAWSMTSVERSWCLQASLSSWT